MINKFQKTLYKIGCAAPILITLGISLLIQETDWKLCIGLIMTGILASIYVVRFIELCKRNLGTLEIEIENIEQNDSEAIAYAFGYLIPMVGVIWKDDKILWVLVIGYIVFFYIKADSLGICPILLSANYHFYKVSLSTGIGNCILISKKQGIRSSDEIKNVVRVSENLLIDEEKGT